MEKKSSVVTITSVLYLLMISLPFVTSCKVYDDCVKQLNDLHAVIKNSNGSQQMIKPCVDVYDQLECRRKARSQCPDLGDKWFELNRLNRDVEDTCSKFCPIILDVMSCAVAIDYDELHVHKSKSAFCRSYLSSFNCSQNLLNGETCPVGPELFESFIEQDTRNLGRLICQSGCSDIDTADKALEYCSSYEDTGDVCLNVQSIQSCIKEASLCPEAEFMMPYYLSEYQNKVATCSPTTVTSVLTRSTLKVSETSATTDVLNKTITDCRSDPVNTEKERDQCDIIACLKRNDVLKTDLQGHKMSYVTQLMNAWDICSTITESNGPEGSEAAYMTTNMETPSASSISSTSQTTAYTTSNDILTTKVLGYPDITNTVRDMDTTRPARDMDTTRSARDMDTTKTARDMDTTRPARDMDTTRPARDMDTTKTERDMDTTRPARDMDTTRPARDIDITKIIGRTTRSPFYDVTTTNVDTLQTTSIITSALTNEANSDGLVSDDMNFISTTDATKVWTISDKDNSFVSRHKLTRFPVTTSGWNKLTQTQHVTRPTTTYNDVTSTDMDILPTTSRKQIKLTNENKNDRLVSDKLNSVSTTEMMKTGKRPDKGLQRSDAAYVTTNTITSSTKPLSSATRRYESSTEILTPKIFGITDTRKTMPEIETMKVPTSEMRLNSTASQKVSTTQRNQHVTRPTLNKGPQTDNAGGNLQSDVFLTVFLPVVTLLVFLPRRRL